MYSKKAILCIENHIICRVVTNLSISMYCPLLINFIKSILPIVPNPYQAEQEKKTCARAWNYSKYHNFGKNI